MCKAPSKFNWGRKASTALHMSLALGSMLCFSKVGAQEAEGVQVSVRLSVFKGDISLLQQDRTTSRPSLGATLPPGSVLSVARNSGAVLRPLPGITLTALSGCELKIGPCIYGGNSSPGSWDATLRKGSCRVEFTSKNNNQGKYTNSNRTENQTSGKEPQAVFGEPTESIDKSRTQIRISTSRCTVLVMGGSIEITESLYNTVIKRSEGNNITNNIKIIGGAGVALNQGLVLVLRGNAQSVVALLYDPANGTIAQISPTGLLMPYRSVAASEMSLLLNNSIATQSTFGSTTFPTITSPDFSQTVTQQPIASPTSP